MKNIKYFALERVSQNIILIDGISRTGKLLLGSLISSFDKMEHLEFGENFEFLLPAVKLKKVDLDFANSYLNNYLNQLIYNKYIIIINIYIYNIFNTKKIYIISLIYLFINILINIIL